ncbi:MAG: o-succinylbenzoate synthase [Melioribacteraceae bacterium]|nr:o-succinylbenzoate synthase [Melioribacteraceae bacterium]
MIIRNVLLIPFSLSLKKNFINSSFQFNTREGIILKLEDNLGHFGYGECSPLPHFSKENLNEIQNELNKFSQFILNKFVDNNFIEFKSYPSVNFCVEQALFNLFLQQTENLNESYTKKIKTSALVGLYSLNETLDFISKKINQGYDTFKLKIGRDNPFDDFLLIEKIREAFGYEIKLRLDVNQKWSCDEAIEYINNLEQFNIEYIEEPCSSLCSNLKTLEDLNFNIALDESLTDFDFTKELIVNSPINIFIVKPMMFGFNNTIELIDLAKTQNKIIIISSLFESLVGKSGLVYLASLPDHNYAHGLDTSEFFNDDIADDFYKAENSIINFDINLYPPKFNL